MKQHEHKIERLVRTRKQTLNFAFLHHKKVLNFIFVRVKWETNFKCKVKVG